MYVKGDILLPISLGEEIDIWYLESVGCEGIIAKPKLNDFLHIAIYTLNDTSIEFGVIAHITSNYSSQEIPIFVKMAQSVFVDGYQILSAGFLGVLPTNSTIRLFRTFESARAAAGSVTAVREKIEDHPANEMDILRAAVRAYRSDEDSVSVDTFPSF